MADVQCENGFTKIANELYDEILTRRFGLRQLNVLHLLIRLSYGFQNTEVQLKNIDFQAVGIERTVIKRILRQLSKDKIIFWDEYNNIFSINKNYDDWKISYNLDAERFKMLTKNQQIMLTKKEHKNKDNKVDVNKKITSMLTNKEHSEAENADSEIKTILPKETKEINEININNTSSSSPADEEEFLKFSSVLQSMTNYQYSEASDKALFECLKKSHPDKNLIEIINSWKIANFESKNLKNPRVMIIRWVQGYTPVGILPAKTEKVRGEVNNYIPPDPASRGSPLDMDRAGALIFIHGFRNFPKRAHPVVLEELIQKWNFTDEELKYGTND